MTTIKIRPAKPLDTSNIARLLIDAHDESGPGAYPPVDHAVGIQWITQTLNSGYVIVADVSGRLVGSLALSNYQFPWSPKWFMYLEWLYVQRKFRNAGTFDALMKACHAYADENNAPILAGISAADQDVYLKDKVMQQRGYIYMGGDFIRSEQGGRQQEADTDTDVSATVVG